MTQLYCFSFLTNTCTLNSLGFSQFAPVQVKTKSYWQQQTSSSPAAGSPSEFTNLPCLFMIGREHCTSVVRLCFEWQLSVLENLYNTHKFSRPGRNYRCTKPHSPAQRHLVAPFSTAPWKLSLGANITCGESERGTIRDTS